MRELSVYPESHGQAGTDDAQGVATNGLHAPALIDEFLIAKATNGEEQHALNEHPGLPFFLVFDRSSHEPLLLKLFLPHAAASQFGLLSLACAS